MKKDYFVITRITALAAMAFALSACPPPPTTVNETKCEADIDCETGLICVSNVCKEYLSCNLKQNGCQGSCDDTAAVGKKCATSGNCKTGQVCLDGACAEKTPCAGDEFGRETEVACECKKLGCRVANDCSPGQQCYDSVCKEPESVAADTCEIMNDQLVFALNPAALATAGPAIKINAVGFKSGVVVPYLRANSVAAATTMRFEVAPGTTDSIRVKANAVAGSELITASFGGVTCTRSFTVARAPTVAESRVVLFQNGVSGQASPISGLTAADIKLFNAAGDVSATATVAEDPAASGIYYVTHPGGFTAAGLHVAPATAPYGATTYYFGAGGTTFDVAIPLEKLDETTGFGGRPSFTAFDKEFSTLTKAEIQGAFAGGSLPLSSLLNFSLDLFAGDTARRTLDTTVLSSGGGNCAVAATNATGNAPLPRALYASLNGGKIGPNCDGVAVRAVPGRRVAWSVGTKVPLAKATGLVGLFPTGSSTSASIDIGKVITSVLPLFDNLAIGIDGFGSASFLARKPFADWAAYREKDASGMQSDNKFSFATISPARRLKFKANFANPGIAADFYPGAAATEKLNGMVALVAAVSPAYGLVPLGFGAGIDADNDGAFDTLSADPQFGSNVIHTRFAATPTELADNEIIGVAVAANFTDLTRSTPNSSAVRVKGVVARNAANGIGWAASSPTLPAMSTAVQGVNFATATYARTLPVAAVPGKITLPAMATVGTVAADLVFVRVSRDTVSRPWNVLVKPSAIGTTIVLPTAGVEGASNIVADVAPNGLTLAATALKFSGGLDFQTGLSATTGKDLNQLASEVSSFALYYVATTRQ